MKHFKETEKKFTNESSTNNNQQAFQRKKFLYYAKAAALIVPTIISTIVLISSIIGFLCRYTLIKNISYFSANNNESIREIAKELYQFFDLELYDAFGLIIALIGVAISIWIGLNIYNTINRKEIEEFYQSINAKMTALEEEYRKSLIDFEKKHRILYLTTILNDHAVDGSTKNYIDYLKASLPNFSNKTIDTIIEMETLLYQYDNKFSSSDPVSTIDKLKNVKSKYSASFESLTQSSTDRVLLSYYHYKLGGVYCRIGDELYRTTHKTEIASECFETAIKEYTVASELDTDFQSIDNGVGFSYLRLAQINHSDKEKVYKAIHHLKLSCQHNPNFEKAFRNLGAAYEASGNINEAIEVYEKAAKLFPGSEFVHICLASAYLKKINTKIKFLNRTKLYTIKDCRLNYRDMRSALIDAKKAKRHAKYVTLLKPKKIDGYYRLIEVYTFQILIKKPADPLIYNSEICRLKNICDIIDSENNAYKCHLRNYYEVIGKIDKAAEFNAKLASGRLDIYNTN